MLLVCCCTQWEQVEGVGWKVVYDCISHSHKLEPCACLVHHCHFFYNQSSAGNGGMVWPRSVPRTTTEPALAAVPSEAVCWARTTCAPLLADDPLLPALPALLATPGRVALRLWMWQMARSACTLPRAPFTTLWLRHCHLVAFSDFQLAGIIFRHPLQVFGPAGRVRALMCLSALMLSTSP